MAFGFWTNCLQYPWLTDREPDLHNFKLCSILKSQDSDLGEYQFLLSPAHVCGLAMPD
jgi:hypothetical protein